MCEYNKKQREAIIEAVRSRLCLIQGPPGTGKTRVIAGIVSNLYKLDPNEKILVLSTRNETTELLAQELYNIQGIKN